MDGTGFQFCERARKRNIEKLSEKPSSSCVYLYKMSENFISCSLMLLRVRIYVLGIVNFLRHTL